MIHYEKNLKPFARFLCSGMTDAEQKLWFHLRRKQIGGVQFYRQRPVGNCIVDFYAPSVRLVIEVDGSQHFEADGKRQDEVRDAWLQQQGLAVMRFDNLQVLRETEAVLDSIARTIEGGAGNGRG